MLDIAQEYIDQYGGSAVRRFAEDLMKGDPTQHKRGYSRENAVIATAEAFGAPRNIVEVQVPRA